VTWILMQVLKLNDHSSMRSLKLEFVMFGISGLI